MQICQNSHFRNESRCNQEQGKKKDKYWHMSQLYDQHQFFLIKTGIQVIYFLISIKDCSL